MVETKAQMQSSQAQAQVAAKPQTSYHMFVRLNSSSEYFVLGPNAFVSEISD